MTIALRQGAWRLAFMLAFIMPTSLAAQKLPYEGPYAGPAVGLAPPSPRPTPPDDASPQLTSPPLGADGVRESVDRHITPAQALWNLRSAWNVAALDCPQPQYAAIQDGYRDFIKANARTLAVINRKVDAEFRKQYGAHYMTRREAYMTEVYNHFALPPTIPYFCEAVAAMARDAAGIKPAGLANFAVNELPTIEAVFDQFFDQYDKYRADAAAWDAKYAPAGPLTAAATPGVSSGGN